LTIVQKKQPKAVQTHHTASVLGAALAKQKKYADAEPLLVAAANAFKADAAHLDPPERQLMLDAVQRVIDLYEAWDHHADEAAHWRQELATLKKE
jgi:hypothetical protein